MSLTNPAAVDPVLREELILLRAIQRVTRSLGKNAPGVTTDTLQSTVTAWRVWDVRHRHELVLLHRDLTPAQVQGRWLLYRVAGLAARALASEYGVTWVSLDTAARAYDAWQRAPAA